MESLLDDLNTPKLLAHLNTLANKLSTANKDEKINIKNNLIAAGKILGILREDPDVWLGYNQSLNPEKEEIEGLINQRNEARRDKDFKLADEIRIDKKKRVKFLSNHAGGILGGISSGQDIISKFVVKPTSSILQSRKTITKHKKETNISTKGRHDPCVGIRAVPIGEAMVAIVLADQALQHIAITRNLKNEKK